MIVGGLFKPVKQFYSSGPPLLCQRRPRYSLHSTVTLLELPGLRDAIKKSSIGEGYRESIIYKFFRSRLILRHSSFRVLSFSSQSLCLAFPVVLFRNKFLFSSCGRLAEVRSTHCQVWQKVFQHATSIANRRKIP